MKRTKLLLLILAIFMPMMVNADTVEIDGIYYYLKYDNTAEVTSNPNKYSGSVTIPETVTYGEVEYSVTSIGEYVFYGNTDLTSISIPNSVITIGIHAFDGCSGLTSVTIGNNVTSIGYYAFLGCSSLTSITIPNSVISIDHEAFRDCSGLTSVTIGNSVTSIGDDAFSGCSGLSSLSVESGNTKYDSRGNCNAIIETETNTLLYGTKNTIIPNTVTSIGRNAFYDCNGLTTITIPNSVTSIGDYAFLGCIGLISLSVDAGNTKYDSRDNCNAIIETETNTLLYGTKNTIIPNTVTSIGGGAFNGCSGLTTITIPNSVTSIGSSAFSCCSGLTSVTIPNSVTSIGSGAFGWCSGLSSLSVEAGNTKYDSRDNCNAIIETETNTLLYGTKNTIIPNTVTSIGRDAFIDCSGLTEITIPNSVTSIGEDAFGRCSGLLSVTIPSSVTSIGRYAFIDCNNLTSVTIEAKFPMSISKTVFPNRANATLYVPAGSKAAYQVADYWKEFKEIIEGNKVTKNVETAGTLSQLISSDEKFTITDLTITGQLNGTDFRLIREMAGCDYQGRPTKGILQKLDFSGANIVAGGDKYFESDGLYNENGNIQYGFDSHSVTTRDNVIGECLFAGCSKLEEIKIPTNIIEIGEYAFMCTKISSFDILEAVEKVNMSFFYGTKVSTLYIPQNVTTLTAADCFMGNQSTLTSITVDANNTKYDSRNNCNAIIEKESKTLILGCKNTTIPDDVTSIGKYAFERFHSLTSITIPTSVTSLQEGAFFDTGLTSISLPPTLKRIEFNALAYNNFASITIPASVEYIGQSVLRACSNLTQIIVETDNTKYDSNDNCNAIIETATNILIQGCKTTTIPATVTSLGDQAFQECHDLASITIPSGVLYIANNAFYDCENLTSVSVGVETPLAITENTFTNRANATLYVPVGSKDAYGTADYWKEFKEIIEENKVIKNVETAGDLSDLISNDDVDAFTITDLTITGQLNGDDLALLRAMAGNDDSGKPTDGMLKKLDLSGANIVAGDKKYLDTDQIISSTQESMPNIGDNSFHYATQENVLGTALFAGCDKLEEIVLPNSIEAIGDYVFWNCLNLKALEIPKNVSSIGWRFINGQNDISKLSVAEGNQTFSSPDGSNALMKGTELVFGLSSTKIPAGTTIIGSEAFYNCTGLGDMTLPEGVTTIKGGAFAWSDLTSIKMPSTLTTIENDAFADCSGLTSFTLPKSVTHYGEGLGALKECGNLASIKVEDGNTKYDSRDNCNAIIETATKTLVSGCKNTVIPNTVTIIGLQAFRGSSLTSIVIPSSVTMIGELAFLYCNNLTSVSVDVTTPLTITENTFTNRANATLYVPAGCKAAYEAADYWKDFKEIIEKEDGNIVNVATAGSLSAILLENEMDPFTITELTLTGELNGEDLALLRAMAGNDEKGKPTDGMLSKLDISGATIVAGGTYMDLDDQFIDLGNDKKLYGFIAGAKTSVANTFGDYLFAGCQKLQSIKTPSTLTTIGERVFAESGLTSIELNSGLTTIVYGAFWSTKLSTITIPNTVTAIGANGWIENPFAYNDNLTSITLETGNTRYEMVANGKLLIDNQNHAVICALGNAEIPADKGLTTIGNNAFCNRPELVNYIIPDFITTLTNPNYPNIGNNTFSQCANLESIVIPEGITVIPNSAFTECPKLKSVTIPSSVTRIGYNTFGNTGLEEITIPASVTYIDNQAFAHNQSLETVISYITNPFDINDDVFAKGWDLSTTTYPKTLKVPAGTKALYEAKTGWKKIANIVEMTQTPAITVTAKNYSRVYGEANPTFEYDETGGTVTGTPAITCAATATSNVGTYDIVISKGTVTSTDVEYVNGTLTINKAPLKISVGNYTKKQGEENPTFSLTYDGFKNNETSAVFTTQPTITCAATKDSPAGSYDITVSGAVAGNYEITYVAGKLTIEAAPEPKGTTFEEDVDDSASSEVNAKFTVTESSGSDTPTVSISSDDDGVSGQLEIPETVTHNGVEYKVTEISDGAFQNNTSLTGVTIPASIVSIKENAFAGCTNLKSITIYVVVPINLATAAARAYVRGITRSTGSSVFEGVDKNTCILYVPEGSVEAYKAAPVWKDFKNILPMGGTTGIYGVELTDGETFDVYNLSGLKVKSKTTSLDGLPKGIYIVKGKKVVK